MSKSKDTLGISPIVVEKKPLRQTKAKITRQIGIPKPKV